MLGMSRGWLGGVGEGVGEDVGGRSLRDGEPGGPSRERRSERLLGSRAAAGSSLGNISLARWKAGPARHLLKKGHVSATWLPGGR